MSLIKKLPYKFRKRCESIATEQRSRIGLKAFASLPARTLAKHHSATVLFPQEIPTVEPEQLNVLMNSDNWSASVIRKEPLWIVHNPRHSLARQESNLMHELAHVLLNHKSVGFDKVNGLPMRCDRDEDEAVFLGGCLQIPRRGLLWAIQKKMSKSQVAEHFMASEQMVSFRSNVTGLTIVD